jgi:hypothetical protein
MDDLAMAAVGQWMQIRDAAANLQEAGRAIKLADQAPEDKSPV